MFEWFTEHLSRIGWEHFSLVALRILLVVVLGAVAAALVRFAMRGVEARMCHHAERQGARAGEAAKRADTLASLLRQGALLFVWVMVLLMILGEVGVSIGPLIASAGIAGLAVGFGAQNLVRDIISGFFLILENQVRVGDVAIVNGTGGLVEQINFRTLVLRDLSGVVHIFPNGTITSMANMTKDWSAYVFDLGVAYKEDTDRVVTLIREVADALRKDPQFGPSILDDVEVFGVDKLADSAVVIKGRLRTLPIKQWEVGREFLRRIKRAFDEANIEIPFPHRSLYFGEASKPIVARLLDAELDSRRAHAEDA